VIGFARRGRKFPLILNPYDFVRFRNGAEAGEIVYTRREPHPTTSSEIFTMSEGESKVHKSNTLSTLLHTAEQI